MTPNPLHRMNLWQKFAAIGALALTLIAIPGAIVLRDRIDTQRVAHDEEAGLAPAAAMLRTIQITQQHRGLAANVLSGNMAFADKRAKAKDDVDAALAKAATTGTELGQRMHTGTIDERMNEMAGQWKTLAGAVGARSISPAESAQRHTRLIESQFALLDEIVSTSTLALDPEAASFYLIMGTLDYGPRLTEYLGQLRALGTNALSKKEITPEQRAAIAGLIGNSRHYSLRVQQALERSKAADATLAAALAKSIGTAVESAKTAADLAEAELVSAAKITFTAPDFHTRMTQAIDSQFDLVTAATGELTRILEARADAARTTVVQVSLALAGGLLAMLVTVWLILRVSNRALRASMDAAQALSRGDLSVKVATDGRNDFGQLAAAVEMARANVQDLLAEVRGMYQRHERGDIDVVIDAGRFQGEFGTMAQGINEMVGAHIDVKKRALGVVAEFSRGNLDADMEKLPGKKAFINDTLDTVRRLLREANNAAAENLRIRRALEAVPSAVMVTDSEGVIRFANSAVLALLRRIEPGLRQRVPDFSADQVLGQNFDRFHRNPAHQRAIVDHLKAPHAAQFKFGEHTIRLTATPISGEDGQRVGTILDWTDRSAEVAAEEDVTALVEAASRGDFSRRVDVARREGFFRTLGEHMNRLVDTTDRSLHEINDAVNRVAQGDLTREFVGEYQGVFARLQGDLNAMTRQLVTTISDVNAAAQALTSASGQVSSTSQSLSQSASEQAASVEQTTASLQEMAASVKQNADNANVTDGMATKAAREADEGGQAV
ncbi:MAG: nitrate- and nitrite sensing domain-containing protein, partial [Burkholderiaceae bacterium]|nr:nitrate- and nitrite sensing domain-containing protein [Burkholderiaceae bacterium]